MPELILLHGWGTSSKIWSDWRVQLERHFSVTPVDLPGYGDSAPISAQAWPQWLERTMQSLPDSAIYLGYSLGGMLAVDIAHRFPERVKAVITIGSNLRFVAAGHWPTAMSVEVYKEFFESVREQPKLALKQFAGLQVVGADNEKQLLRPLRKIAEEFAPDALESSLQLLTSIDNCATVNQLQVPALYLFGENDALVPVAATEALRLGLASKRRVASVEVVAGAPHALFLSHPEHVLKSIQNFLSDQCLLSDQSAVHHLDKQQVARSFSRAASTYDSVADLQRRVGDSLMNYLPQGPLARVLDLGCGTGHFSPQLLAHYSSAQVIGLDLAEGMAAYAADHHGADNQYWLCGDAENLPLADNSIDLIYSSLAIQWCEDNVSLLAEIYRVLAPGGQFLFSTLGPNTLQELRIAWSAVDDYVHVNRFVEQSVLVTAAGHAGFDAEAFKAQWVEENITLEYDTLKNLTRELKALGAHNVNQGRPAGLMGKRRMRTFIEAYEEQRSATGLLPATYQVWYGALTKLQD